MVTEKNSHSLYVQFKFKITNLMNKIINTHLIFIIHSYKLTQSATTQSIALRKGRLIYPLQTQSKPTQRLIRDGSFKCDMQLQ